MAGRTDARTYRADAKRPAGLVMEDISMTNSNDALRAALESKFREMLPLVWTNFLDANPDEITSPEEYPDHALMTGRQFEEWAMDAFLSARAISTPSPVAGGDLREVIILTAAEKQSGFDRVKWAEGLIRQLPDTHEGRNSWLLNYGRSDEADERRQAYNADRTARGLPLAEYADLNQSAAPVEAELTYAGDDWKLRGYISHAAEIEDMANVGRALMQVIERDYSSHPFMKHWHPADCPSEIVGDLLSALDDAMVAPVETELRASDAVLANANRLAARMDGHFVPHNQAASAEAAWPQTIGRLHLGDIWSDGDVTCAHSHSVTAGHPLYWPEQMGEYDDRDAYCLAHAIDQAESDASWCGTCLDREHRASGGGAAPVEAGAWRSMDTAPKDGTAIFAILTGSDLPHSIRYKFGKWRIAWDDYDLSADCDAPRCWLPIPPEPAASTVAQGDDAQQLREKGQGEGFAAAIQWLRDRSAMKPPATLWHAAAILADQLERSRIPATHHKGSSDGQ